MPTLTAIPFLGFVPDLASTPPEVAGLLSRQLNVDAGDLGRYDAEAHHKCD